MSIDAPRLYDDALHLMEEQGGGFVQSLAACYYRADQENRKILRAAFSTYFDTYERRFAEHKAATAMWRKKVTP